MTNLLQPESTNYHVTIAFQPLFPTYWVPSQLCWLFSANCTFHTSLDEMYSIVCIRFTLWQTVQTKLAF